MDNKRKLYLALVRSKLIYPPIPIRTASKTQISTLQKVQNRVTRLITNTTTVDRQRSERLHELPGLDPINVTLHRQAENIWTNIRNTFRASFTEKWSKHDNNTYNSHFTTSIHKTQLPTPLYL